jgi:hypothetical protein
MTALVLKALGFLRPYGAERLYWVVAEAFGRGSRGGRR